MSRHRTSTGLRSAGPLLVILALLLAACGTEPAAPTPITGATAPTAAAATAAPATQVAAGQQGPTMKNPNQVVVVSQDLGWEDFDPAYCYNVGCSETIQNIYDGLILPKQEKVDEFIPQLATKWDISPDGKTYTFTIRQGVKFQQGQALTPEDVAYSFWRAMAQDRAGGPSWLLLQPFFGLNVQSFASDVVTTQNKGDWAAACTALQQKVTFDNAAGTVTLHLAQAFPPFMQILAGTWAYVVSKPWVTAQGGWDGSCATVQKYHDPQQEADELFKVANGTGPYMLDHWTPAEEIAIVRNPTYWRTEPMWDGGPSGLARIERVTWKVSKEWGTRLSALEAGDADYVDIPDPYRDQVDPLVKETCDYRTNQCTTVNPNGSIKLYKYVPTDNQAGAYFLTQHVDVSGGNTHVGSGVMDGGGVPPDFFADVHVRKAFNYVYDAQTIIDQVYKGEAAPGTGLLLPGVLGYQADQPTYSYDLAKAADEFKAATLKSPDGKTLWDTGFTLEYLWDEGGTHVEGDILKDSLAKVNPKFKLNEVAGSFDAMTKDFLAGRTPLFGWGWVEDFHDPHDWVFPYLGSTGAFASVQHFAPDLQTQFDQMIAQGIQETDSAKRAALYHQLDVMTYDNALDIFVVRPTGRRYEPEWIHGWYGTRNPLEPGNYYYFYSKGT